MRTSLISKSIALLLLASAIPCFAQDYPYDDVTQKKLDEQKLPTETADSKTGETTETTPVKKRVPSLFRLGIKAGGNYALFQNPDPTNSAQTVQVNGFGFEGMLAFGWDLAYQPAFIEFESGYRGLFLAAATGAEALHVIPLTVGLHYRERIGRTATWRPGLKSSLELRFTSSGSTTTFGILPTVGISSLVEFNGLLLEPLVTFARLQSQYTFLIFAFRAGYRF